MTDEFQIPSSQQEIPPPVPPVTTPLVAQHPKSNRKKLMIAGIVVAVLLLCSTTCVVLFGTGLYKVYTEKAPVETVLGNYMQYMEDKDAESAYALFSPRVHRLMPISDIEDSLKGNNYILFEGYESLSVSDINISASANTNRDLPQGTVATVTGNILFEGNIQGSFNGTLEKVDGVWMIYGMQVTVPPDKFK